MIRIDVQRCVEIVPEEAILLVKVFSDYYLRKTQLVLKSVFLSFRVGSLHFVEGNPPESTKHKEATYAIDRTLEMLSCKRRVIYWLCVTRQ